uniref:protein xylosyltransferase n=1 Tax=Anopheles epiroticus TaxID=199890 RepID=A0A182PIG7_9DIPT
MASQPVVNSSCPRVGNLKAVVFGVILLVSIVTLLLKSIIYSAVLTTTEHSTVAPTNSLIISNGTVYKLPCALSEPKALHAIKRAVSDECKIKLANAACKNAQGKLTPRKIVSQCPRGGYVPYRLVGCFPMKKEADETMIGVLPNNTPKTCVDYCMQRNFYYAIVRHGYRIRHTCCCGDDRPNPEEKLSDRECNAPCTGNSAQFCGGILASSIYETGLAKHPQLPLKLRPSPTDQPVRIAFLLMFYKRNLRQIRRLIRGIYDRNHYYYIHVDPEQNYLFRELLKLEKQFPNVHVSRQRHTINWACFSQLQTVLAALKHILSIRSWNPDYILNMSESDFPLKTANSLTQLLTANRGRNFLQMQDVVTVDNFITRTGYNKLFCECDNRMWLIGDRQPPYGIVTNGGSDWFCLTRDFVQYALDMRQELVVDLMAVMEHTVHPTESFFHQLLLNSRFCQTHYNGNMRLISWLKGKGCAMNRSVDWAACSPVTIRRDHFTILESHIAEDIYAVRKFNPIFDQMVILTLEEYAFGKYPTNVPNLNAYWQNVYHHEDETHEARMSAVLNVAYALLYLNAQNDNRLERYEVVKILEVTHYFNRNAFEGFLIRHIAQLDDHRFELEVFAKPRNKFKPRWRQPDQLTNLKLMVSNKIDVVENEPIDFDRVLTVDNRPWIVLQLSKFETLAQSIHHNVSVEWIDPHQQSIVVEQYSIQHTPHIIGHYPHQSVSLETPLSEGVWCAKVSMNDSFVGSIDFMVVKNEPIFQTQTLTSTDACDRTRGFVFESNTCDLSHANVLLQKHLNFRTIVAQMYHIESTCLVGEVILPEQFNMKPFERCSSTLWSSFAPDPKTPPGSCVEKAMQKCSLRLLWRYKVFVLIGFMIVAGQVFLAYKLLRMPLSGNETIEERDLSRKLYEKYVKKPAPDDTNHPTVAADRRKGTADAARHERGAAGDGHHQNQHILRLDELDFVPPCELTRKETVSAVHRAKSQSCKAKIVEVACEIQAGKFYPQRLPTSCPRGDHSPNRALGCFRDEKNFRLLSGYYSTFKTNNSPEKCIRLCLQSGYPFAGVQYGYECFCGDEVPKASAKLPDSSCNIKCPGDPKQACGGYFTINVYETGIRKFAAQSTETVPKRSDETVRVAFLLTLNGRAVRQFPNIRLARKRFSTIWGGASLLQMLLSCMEYLLYESSWQWDFVLNLSESDFPLKTVDHLVTFLTANRGQNFVRNHGREVQRFIQKQGLDMTFVECDNRMWRIGDRALPAGITIDGGSDWVCLSRDFARYVTGDGVKQHDELIKGLLRVFEYTILPAESFFHTALRNSRFCHTYTNNNLHMTNWKRQLGCKCQYRHIVDWCGCSPNNFRTEDWERLQASQQKKLFFARKFEAMVNQAIVLQLEEWMFGPYPAEYPNLHSYWQNVYHHEDTATPVDGALLNVAYSLLRINGRTNSVQFYEPGRIREISHYFERDTYRGFLVRHEAVGTEKGIRIELETLISPVVTAKVTRTTPLARRVIHLEVSTEYDEKEQLSRNFPRIIGTNAEPALIFRLAPPLESERLKGASVTNYSLTVEWIDPVGTIVAASHFTIEDSPNGPPHSFNHFLKSGNKLKLPLAEGVWGARLLQGKALLGTTRFLITDSTLREGRDVENYGHERHTHRQVLPLRGGSANTATSKIRAKDRRQSSLAVGHSGDRHDRWQDSDDQLQYHQLDKLVSQFFTLRETCTVALVPFNEESNRFVDCKSTSWSSLAADPKSDIDVESVTLN